MEDFDYKQRTPLQVAAELGNRCLFILNLEQSSKIHSWFYMETSAIENPTECPLSLDCKTVDILSRISCVLVRVLGR